MSLRPHQYFHYGELIVFVELSAKTLKADPGAVMKHALAKFARSIDWKFLEEKFGAVYQDGCGGPKAAKSGQMPSPEFQTFANEIRAFHPFSQSTRESHFQRQRDAASALEDRRRGEFA